MNIFKGSQPLPLVLNLVCFLSLSDYFFLVLHLLSTPRIGVKYHSAISSVMKNLPQRKASRQGGGEVS